MASSLIRLLDHTQRRTTLGRTTLDEWSALAETWQHTTHTTDGHPCPRWDSKILFNVRINWQKSVKTCKREREKRVKDRFKYFSRVSYDFLFNNPKGSFNFCVLAHRPTMMSSVAYDTGGLLHGAESYFNEYRSAGDKIYQPVLRNSEKPPQHPRPCWIHFTTILTFISLYYICAKLSEVESSYQVF